jgi:hypothetical protein
MYERRGEPLLPHAEFMARVRRHVGASLAVLGASLAAGVLGYHLLEGLSWVDSLLNASMILGGMGPVDTLHTTGGKLFASLYALYSGILVLAVAGVLFAPIIHRSLHHFHVEDPDDDSKPADSGKG